MLVDKQIEKIINEYLIPFDSNDKITVLPFSKSFNVETCLQQILSRINFSADVLVQAVRSHTGEVWISAVTYARVGQAFRPVVLLETTEPCMDMRRSDLVAMLIAVVKEIEIELEFLRQEDVQLATGDTLRLQDESGLTDQYQ